MKKNEQRRNFGLDAVFGVLRFLYYLFFLFAVLSFFPLIVFSQDMQDIRDIRPPVDYPTNWLFWIFVAGFILLIFIVWSFLRHKRFAQIKPQPVSVKAPWDIARDALRSLKEKGYPGKGLIKEYYFQLTYILRQYIEDRFLLKAPEMTTEEFLDSVRDSQSLNTQQKKSLGEFLISCDMIKFAKYSAGMVEMEESYQLVMKFVEETRGKDAEA